MDAAGNGPDRGATQGGRQQPVAGRRSIIARLLGAALLPAGRNALAATVPDAATVLVAGPDGGLLDIWADALLPAIGRALPPGSQLRKASIGGVDGVTGANQFDARAVPDGGTLLFVPGDAALAWLAGDPRAQFDAGRWVGVLAADGPVVVAGRASVADLAAHRSLRLAANAPNGPAMAALLALELLGAPGAATFGLADEAAERAAFVSGQADLVLLRDARVAERLGALRGAGAQPLFTFGVTGEDGAPARDPRFPDVPHMAELHLALRRAAPAGPLYQAWRAAAAAAGMAFGLVLPQLTPAAIVAQWRRAGTQAAGAPEMQAVAQQAAIRPLAAAAAAASTSVIAADPAALLDLRTWLAARWNYPPT
jgi:hypothetical protein